MAKNTTKDVRLRFESLNEFAKWLDDNKKNSENWNYDKASEYKDYEFSLTNSFEEANEMMLNGWDYGCNEVSKIMAERFEGVQEVKRLTLSYVGVVPCVPAYLAGSPKNMIAVNRRNVSRPVVSIFYNSMFGGSIPGEKIRETAAKLFNVIRGLEAGGVSVELYTGFCINARRGGGSFALAVKIKTAGQPLNVLNMCYPIVHPSFLRRQYFAALERSGVNAANWTPGYGRITRDCGGMVADLGFDNINIFDYYKLENKTEKEIAEMIK